MLPSSYITVAEKIKSFVRFLNHLNDFKITLYDFFFYNLFNDLENRFNDLEIRSDNLKKSFQRFRNSFELFKNRLKDFKKSFERFKNRLKVLKSVVRISNLFIKLIN